MTHPRGASHYTVECACGTTHTPHEKKFQCEYCGRLIEICWPANYKEERDHHD